MIAERSSKRPGRRKTLYGPRPSFGLVGLIALALTLASLGQALSAQYPNPKSPRHIANGELTNPLLSAEYARWLVGPISWMLEKQEIDRYLFLSSDEEARAFIEEFWAERQDIRTLWDERVAEADKLYREKTTTGRRTDRGTIYILHGTPESTGYEDKIDVVLGDVELWEYPKGSPLGLDGREPNRRYRFVRDGDVTIFFQRDHGREQRRRLKQRQRGIPRPPFGR